MKNVSEAIQHGKLPELGHKTAYLLSLYMTTPIAGAVLGYLYGTNPESLKDYLFPRTGKFQKDGTPERVSMPSYVKDIYEYGQHPIETLAHKANPWIGVLHDEIVNQDYFGNPLYNPEAGALEEFRDRVGYLGRAFLPFSLTGERQMLGSGDPGLAGSLARVGPFVGITPAPGAITKPEKMAEFQHYQDEKGWQKKLQMDLKKAVAAGDTEKAAEIRKQLNEANQALRRSHNDYLREKAAGAKAAQRPTSQLIQQVAPLIDSSGSRAEMADKIKSAGFPALAGLIGSLPTTLRPQVMARLAEYA
jgi:hypothetical protein